jgi:hypothetical protein
MKTKMLAMLSIPASAVRKKKTMIGAAIALTMSASCAFAGYMVPGETMGLSALSPLPEGLFLVDTNDYGRADNAAGGNGVAIPIFVYSTPFTYQNTRLEFAAALPFAYLDHAGPVANGVHAITYAAGPLFAHDFGNGLTGGLGVLFRSGDPDYNFSQRVDGRTVFEFDIRESLQYKYSGPGFLNGIVFIENAAYTTPASSSYGPTTSSGALVQNNFFAGDFTIEKSFDKLTVGFVGYGNIDTDNRNLAGKVSNVELGGLVGYDFGKFNLTGIVTRTVLTETAGLNNGAYETRGWLRLIVPLYVAPTAAPVVARY